MIILGTLQKLKLVKTLLTLNHSLGFSELTQQRWYLHRTLSLIWKWMKRQLAEQKLCDTKLEDSKASNLLLSYALYTSFKNWNWWKVSAKISSCLLVFTKSEFKRQISYNTTTYWNQILNLYSIYKTCLKRKGTIYFDLFRQSEVSQICSR